ncbi:MULTISPECIES: ABC transporter permease subunit [unclassified Bradyrhizobium]
MYLRGGETYLLILVLTFGAYLFLQWPSRTPLGTLTMAIRSNENRTRFFGSNVTSLKLFLFVVSAMLASLVRFCVATAGRFCAIDRSVDLGCRGRARRLIGGADRSDAGALGRKRAFRYTRQLLVTVHGTLVCRCGGVCAARVVRQAAMLANATERTALNWSCGVPDNLGRSCAVHCLPLRVSRGRILGLSGAISATVTSDTRCCTTVLGKSPTHGAELPVRGWGAEYSTSPSLKTIPHSR